MYRILLATLIFCVTHSSQLWADIQVQGYLNQAAMENLASAPTCAPAATCPLGRIYWDTTANEPRIWDGSVWQEMLVGAAAVPDPLQLGPGGAGSPTYSFADDTDTGIYLRTVPGEIGIAVDGSDSFRCGSALCLTNIEHWFQGNSVKITEAEGIVINTNNVTDNIEIEFIGTESGEIHATANAGQDLYLAADDRIYLRPGNTPGIDTIFEDNGQILAENGSATSPTFSFNGDSNTGMFSDGNGITRFTSDGATSFGITGGKVFVGDPAGGGDIGNPASPQYTFSGQDDIGMYLRTNVSLGFSTSGSERLIIGNTLNRHLQRVEVPDGSVASTPVISFIGDTNTGLFGGNGNTGLSYNGTPFAAWSGSGGTGTDLRVGSTTSPTTACINVSGSGNRNLRACSSSIRYKKDVVPVNDEQIEKSFNLEPVSFTWKESGKRDYGLIAEEVEKHMPLLVHYAPPPEDENTEDESKWIVQGVNYKHFTALLLAQNKRQEEKIKELYQRIEALEAQ